MHTPLHGSVQEGGKIVDFYLELTVPIQLMHIVFFFCFIDTSSEPALTAQNYSAWNFLIHLNECVFIVFMCGKSNVF